MLIIFYENAHLLKPVHILHAGNDGRVAEGEKSVKEDTRARLLKYLRHLEYHCKEDGTVVLYSSQPACCADNFGAYFFAGDYLLMKMFSLAYKRLTTPGITCETQTMRFRTVLQQG
jgi:hypothetical protein